jgi:hypothetical protein
MFGKMYMDMYMDMVLHLSPGSSVLLLPFYPSIRTGPNIWNYHNETTQYYYCMIKNKQTKKPKRVGPF